MKILCVVGTRPNFIKMAPLYQALQRYATIQPKLVHTGQHYDENMSGVFFDQLTLPPPDYVLTPGTGTINQQLVRILDQFAALLEREQPDWVLVVGDVTSTLACALAAAQHGSRVAHVEAGLRSNDPTMPEERNRKLTDALSDLLFVTEPSALTNLQREGIPADKVYFVGNVLIDALIGYQCFSNPYEGVSQLGLKSKQYALVTMHRPTNVDTADSLSMLLRLLMQLADELPVVLPLHPRTRANLVRYGLLHQLERMANVRVLAPQGYLAFLNLMKQATVAITDSGGIQEETTYLNVPCLTMRATTERPITVEWGTNELVPGLDWEVIKQRVSAIRQGQRPAGRIPPLWDGKASERIAQILAEIRTNDSQKRRD